VSKHAAEVLGSAYHGASGTHGETIQLDAMHSQRTGLIAPLLIGLFAFVVNTGGAILWPENIAWLDGGDMRQHFLG
jgi:hypothetical protein